MNAPPPAVSARYLQAARCYQATKAKTSNESLAQRPASFSSRWPPPDRQLTPCKRTCKQRLRWDFSGGSATCLRSGRQRHDRWVIHALDNTLLLTSPLAYICNRCRYKTGWSASSRLKRALPTRSAHGKCRSRIERKRMSATRLAALPASPLPASPRFLR